ncbi:MAG TPA: arginine--tRNA ligase [Flavobacteriales bacterium]|jgi:arginyl-tRNA synthetase|nr:arginine--tRNA ligase [Flavobacteriales bacterium]MDB9701314.1 arginine--tRNA ligase [Salibacteraceae bacterium]HAW19063.1 arginine--tRNA ligase [Flavobacteriales bacterium]
MTNHERILETLEAFVRTEIGVEIDRTQLVLDETRKEFEGDFTLVVFPLVKMFRSAPEAVANKVGEHLIQSLKEIESFNVIKGFLNLKMTSDYWTRQLAEAGADSNFFSPRENGDVVLVEYSSPNTNKPLHLGHLRNNFLGHSVSLMKAFSGDDVVKTQIINDRGVHICKSMLAWRKFGDGETPESSGLKGDKLVGKYYVIFDQHLRSEISELEHQGVSNEEAKKAAPLMMEVQEMLQKWEANDPEIRKLWSMMNGWVYAGFEHTYDRMQVSFDHLYYESETYLKGKDIVVKGLADGVFYKKEDGSVWCDLEAEGLDHKLLIRGDGTTVYMTQDIGTAVLRFEDYPEMTQAIYTVGDEQDYHFKVLFKILEKLGYSWAPNCRHLSYGMVDLPSGKMKSREGTVVDADDLMVEVVRAAQESSQDKGRLDSLSESEQRDLFETLGIGALKFFLLRVDPKKRMMFDPEESVALNGDTGPFVQYTYARCRAVLRKSGADPIRADLEGVQLMDKERALLRGLMSFRAEMNTAAMAMNPSAVANYCLEIAKVYNQFYHDIPILTADGAERSFRLELTRLTSETIKVGMSLLGIDVPEQM